MELNTVTLTGMTEGQGHSKALFVYLIVYAEDSLSMTHTGHLLNVDPLLGLFECLISAIWI